MKFSFLILLIFFSCTSDKFNQKRFDNNLTRIKNIEQKIGGNLPEDVMQEFLINECNYLSSNFRVISYADSISKPLLITTFHPNPQKRILLLSSYKKNSFDCLFLLEMAHYFKDNNLDSQVDLLFFSDANHLLLERMLRGYDKILLFNGVENYASLELTGSNSLVENLLHSLEDAEIKYEVSQIIDEKIDFYDFSKETNFVYLQTASQSGEPNYLRLASVIIEMIK